MTIETIKKIIADDDARILNSEAYEDLFVPRSDSSELTRKQCAMLNDLVHKGYHGCGICTDEPSFTKFYNEGIEVTYIVRPEGKTYDKFIAVEGKVAERKLRIRY